MKNKFIKYALIVTSFIGFTGCNDYLDVNENTNNPSGQPTPETIFAGSQTTLANTFSIRMNQLGNVMMSNWSANGIDFADPFGDEFRYNITNEFYDDIWNNLYQNTKNLSYIENYSDGKNWDNYKAASKILKAFYMQYIVDLYGDCPYSETHQGISLPFPKYDDDKQIYADLIDLVDEAKEIITNIDTSTTVDMTNSDVIFFGDMGQWLRLANTVKLRLLVRQITIAKTDGQINALITKEFNELNAENAQFLNIDVTINPGYLNLQGKQNPFFAAYGFDVLGNDVGAFNQIVPSKYAENFLKGNTVSVTTVDPRGTRLWKTRDLSAEACSNTGSDIIGVTPGDNSRGSNLGNGILCSSDQDLPFMLASESHFLQAEAIEEGYLTVGNAQAAFESGIRASFNYLDLPITSANGYIASTSNSASLGWNGGNRNLAIANQKWVALTSINGIELWIEHTRTGLPNSIPLPPQATSPTSDRPIRLMYPKSEYDGNSNNVIPQTTNDAFTSKVFWDN